MEEQERARLLQDFERIRQQSQQLTEGLTEADMQLQSMEDASPTKWHLAHTTWFFEEFILQSFLPGFKPYHEEFRFLFNSYYEAVGKRHQRPLRGMLSRPSLNQILQYRDAINEQILALLDQQHGQQVKILTLLELGLHHEMQHQELLVTDILHALSIHPFFPAVKPATEKNTASAINSQEFTSYEGGLIQIGHQGVDFYYDCESPRHSYFQAPYAIGNRLITNGQWLEFMRDKGYHTATLWLSEGWARCCSEQWQAPLYWHQQDGQWFQYGLDGLQPLDMNAPVCHISYFEADAFATWAGQRLPTEQEWEWAATQQPIEGNFLEQQHWRPLQASNQSSIQQLYGHVWEWTQSTFSPYPGFRIADGAIGEYNGKFMCGQFVLRGGSCATPKQQIRPTYRNFFYPHQRWQFSGLRLAKDL